MGSSPSDAATERQGHENDMLGSSGLSCQVDDSRPPVILNCVAFIYRDFLKINSPHLPYIALVGLLSSQEQQDGLEIVSGGGKNNAFVWALEVSRDYKFRKNMPECLRYSCAESENTTWHTEKLGN